MEMKSIQLSVIGCSGPMSVSMGTRKWRLVGIPGSIGRGISKVSTTTFTILQHFEKFLKNVKGQTTPLKTALVSSQRPIPLLLHLLVPQRNQSYHRSHVPNLKGRY